MVPFRGMGGRVMAGLIWRTRKRSPTQCSIPVDSGYTYEGRCVLWLISPFSPQQSRGKVKALVKTVGRLADVSIHGATTGCNWQPR